MIGAICGVLDRCPSILTYDSIIADDILAALKAARIAVVELPEPIQRWDGEPMAWMVDGDGYVEVRKTDGYIGQVMVGNPMRDLDEVRQLAAALLAAADAAEAVQ